MNLIGWEEFKGVPQYHQEVEGEQKILLSDKAWSNIFCPIIELILIDLFAVVFWMLEIASYSFD